MDTDLDPDDAIGRRFGALRTWEPPVPVVDAWPAVERRRSRRRARRYSLTAVAIVIVVVGSVTAVTSLRSSDGKSDRQIVVTPVPQDPPIVSVLPTAPVGGIDLQPAGPYRAGQPVRATVRPAYHLEDPFNELAELCFTYGDGEICDRSVESTFDASSRPPKSQADAVYKISVPGWVHTPTGLRPCPQVDCRIEMVTSGGRIGTPPLAIEPGPKPFEPVRVTGVHRDESLISLHVDGLEPDPSWVAANLPAGADLHAGYMSICAFAETLLCDALVQPDPPPFDGLPHDLTVETNRLLLTPRGWVDCVHYVCAIVVTRTINVERGDGGFGSNTEIVAIVPYQLPATTPAMARPSLTMDRTGPFAVNDEVAVTLHDPPPNIDAAHRLLVGQCWHDDLRVAMSCLSRFSDDSQQTQSWTRLADGSLRQQWRITACAEPRGCYLAIEPLVKGYPEVARTIGRFAVSP